MTDQLSSSPAATESAATADVAPSTTAQPPANDPDTATPAPADQIEADTTTDDGDRDSAYEQGSNASTSSTSIASSILNYEYANGRRYHAYRKGAYLLPNDEEEQDRLDLLHHCSLMMLNGRLFTAPLRNPQCVLDVGTGTGLWVIDFADEFPAAQVIGTDLSPIQPGWVPSNAQFYVEDLEADWVFGAHQAFDMVHTRVMGGSISDWDKFCRQAFSHLKSGGFLELQEPEAWMTSDDDSKDRAEFTNQFQAKCNEAAGIFGKELNLASSHKQRLIDAGFVDVRDEVMKIPVGSWPKDRRLKELGRYFGEHIMSGVEVYALGFIGKVLQWSELECRVLTAKVREELRDRKNHLYINMHFVHGRKP